MANNSVDELTVNFQDENGVLLCKEVDKEVLTKGTWATLMFKYQDLDKATGQYKIPKYSIRRYQKRGGEYRVMSKFTISSAAQAGKICAILTRWIENEAVGDSGAEAEE
jgi:hypothetical protein